MSRISNVIETLGLSKAYRRRVALHPINFVVPSGALFGYLGPNGAGKTTTIRMLLGLARPTGGSIRILSQEVPDGLALIRKRLGSVLEDPAFYPGLSARENLKLLAYVSGDSPTVAHIDSLIERVGLSHSTQFVGAFSRGMRQRLGIAAALLHKPDLIVLDEPTHSLDPAGIRDVRALLESLRDEGKTIFLSSHLLSEVEQLCDQVCVLREGHLVYQGSLAGLIAGQDRVRVEIQDLEEAERLALSLGWAVSRSDNDLLIEGVQAREVNRIFGDHRLYPDGIRVEPRKLEEVFFELTEGSTRA